MHSSKNINLKDYIETRLLEWASWSKYMKMSHLDYPKKSIIAKMVEGNIYFGKNINFFSPKEDDNPKAEEMDKFICKLSRHNKYSAQALKIEYLREGSQINKAKVLNMSRTQFEIYVNTGKTWLINNWNSMIGGSK